MTDETGWRIKPDELLIQELPRLSQYSSKTDQTSKLKLGLG